MQINKFLRGLGLFVFSISAYGKSLEINGTVTNLEFKSGVPNITVYKLGFPFFGTNEEIPWEPAGRTKYHKDTGQYSITLDIGEETEKVIISAQYKGLAFFAMETDIAIAADVKNKEQITVNFQLPDDNTKRLSFKTRIYLFDKEFDYSENYSCILTSKSFENFGRIIFFSNDGYNLDENLVNNLPDGDYRLLCSVKNPSGNNPASFSRYIDIKLPLRDSNGNLLPDSDKKVDVKISGTNVIGESL